MEEELLSIKIVTALLLYNAYILLNLMEICVANNIYLFIYLVGAKHEEICADGERMCRSRTI